MDDFLLVSIRLSHNSNNGFWILQNENKIRIINLFLIAFDNKIW